jgi:hypothetical protein
MPLAKIRTIAVLAAVALMGAAVAASAAPRPPAGWASIGKARLTVTEGTISVAAPNSTLRTTSPAMRAVSRDGGRHASSARLWFRYLGESSTTKPLGSGQVRRQIGLKLRAADPCNLVYVMWHVYPDNVIEVSVKRNPGQSTSAQCGNRGYKEITEFPVRDSGGTADHGPHVLEVVTRRTASGSLALRIYSDNSLRRRLHLPAALTAGMEGPIGVRSDNGHYLFQLSGRR